MRFRFQAARERKTRGFGFENLEKREMLSAVPPTVTGVGISSTNWSQDFLDSLQAPGTDSIGYRIPVGSTAQSTALPWDNLDTINITFSEDVHIDKADLSISGVTNTNYSTEHFFYDPVKLQATWTLSSPIASQEKVWLDLDSDGISPVTDLDGNLLDGEWTHDVSSFNSGNGVVGGDFEFAFNVLRGDAFPTPTPTVQVHYMDYIDVALANGLTTQDPSYEARFDIDGSGLVDSTDVQIVLAHMWNELPSGTPAGNGNDAPTTVGVDLSKLTDRVNDYRISLDAAFEDLEDTDAQLTYSIESQTNSSLFDSVSIDHSTGELVVNAASAGTGRSEIAIKATDTAGLSVKTIVPIDVDRDNAAPVISGYLASWVGGNSWEITGTVSDADDDVEGMIVSLTGLFSARVAVQADGSFVYEYLTDPGEADWEYASVTDPHGEESNNPITYVGV